LKKLASKAFDVQLERAATMKRNIIIDQTNVDRRARARKLRPFTHFRRRAVVVQRPLGKQSKGHWGKVIPEDTVNVMQAGYALPGASERLGAEPLFAQIDFQMLVRAWSTQSSNTKRTPPHTH